MPHQLELEYGLSAHELLDALANRFRAKVTLEGAVAEIQMERKIQPLVGTVIDRYEAHDTDGHPDFSIWLPGAERAITAECKNVRNHNEAYRIGREIVAYKVETQKTRAARGDFTSRYYGFDQFDILGVCLGKKTKDWSQFMFAWVKDLQPHREHPTKLAVMQRVPLPGAVETAPWSSDLGELLRKVT
jgi:hypothetical protein